MGSKLVGVISMGPMGLVSKYNPGHSNSQFMYSKVFSNYFILPLNPERKMHPGDSNSILIAFEAQRNLRSNHKLVFIWSLELKPIYKFEKFASFANLFL